MSRWWLSWYEPVDESRDFRPITWPLSAGIDKYWCSGETDDAAILCAVVDAHDENAAKALIDDAWKHGQVPITWRFVDAVEAGWWPDAGRFPR